jgi:hypothetical protein
MLDSEGPRSDPAVLSIGKLTNMGTKGFWKRVLDRAMVTGFTLVILGLVSVQLFDVAGMASHAYGRGSEASSGPLGVPSGIVAPVLEADLGSAGDESPSLNGIRASLWLAPIASLRGGFGLGWLESVEGGDGFTGTDGRRELRLRLGGGLMAPLTPSMGVDLQAGA